MNLKKLNEELDKFINESNIDQLIQQVRQKCEDIKNYFDNKGLKTNNIKENIVDNLYYYYQFKVVDFRGNDHYIYLGSAINPNHEYYEYDQVEINKLTGLNLVRSSRGPVLMPYEYWKLDTSNQTIYTDICNKLRIKRK